jgi:hypothetical protein
MGFDLIIQLLPYPTSLKELRGALGSLSYFRGFIPNFTVEYILGTDAKIASADLLSRQGHDVSVQGVQISDGCDIAEGTPQLTSILGADEFRIYQLEDKARCDHS